MWAHTTRSPDRPSLHTTDARLHQCLIWQLASLGAQVQPDIVHPRCDQLTGVKTGYPLTSITWPYRGLSNESINVEYLFAVIGFQMITSSSSSFLHWKEVAFISYTITVWRLQPGQPKDFQPIKNHSCNRELGSGPQRGPTYYSLVTFHPKFFTV